MFRYLKHRLARIPRAPAAILLAAAFLALPLTARADPRTEYTLKAEFLYNFAKFVSWPAESWPADNEPIVFCSLGSGPIHSLLEELMRNRRVKERAIEVRPITSAEFVSDCHVLFASSDGDAQLQPILAGAKNSSVMTVGESESFYAQGGMIRFVLSGGRLRFDVNVTAANAGNLKISSQLLKLARTVDR